MTVPTYSSSSSAIENPVYFLPEAQQNTKIQQETLEITVDLTSKDILEASCEKATLYQLGQKLAVEFTIATWSKARIYENIHEVRAAEKNLRSSIRPDIVEDSMPIILNMPSENTIRVLFQNMVAHQSSGRIRSLAFIFTTFSRIPDVSDPLRGSSFKQERSDVSDPLRGYSFKQEPIYENLKEVYLKQNFLEDSKVPLEETLVNVSKKSFFHKSLFKKVRRSFKKSCAKVLINKPQSSFSSVGKSNTCQESYVKTADLRQISVDSGYGTSISSQRSMSNTASDSE